MLSAGAAEREDHRLRHRRRTVYLALALAYGLQRILQPCLLRLLSSLLTNAGGPLGVSGAVQARHLPLWVSAALPAAVLADTFGPAAVLAASLASSALAVLLLPLAVSAGSATVLTHLLGASSLLQGAVFPCIVALQARWIPRGGLDDIWASRTLGVGAVLAELFANAAPVAWSPALGASPRSWRGTTTAVAALSGLLGGCALLVGLAAPQATNAHRGAAAERPTKALLPMRTLVSARPIQAILVSAFAAGSALGAAEVSLSLAPSLPRSLNNVCVSVCRRSCLRLRCSRAWLWFGSAT